MWKEIAGFCKYMASDTGEIMRKETGKILKPRPLPSGYLRVYLTNDDGDRMDLLVHRIICRTFHGEPPQGMSCVNHKDCDKRNNMEKNLEWCSHKMNMRHASRNNLLQSQGRHMREVNARRRVPVKAIDHFGKTIFMFPSIEEAIQKGYSSVSYSLKNQTMTKKGLKWERA